MLQLVSLCNHQSTPESAPHQECWLHVVCKLNAAKPFISPEKSSTLLRRWLDSLIPSTMLKKGSDWNLAPRIHPRFLGRRGGSTHGLLDGCLDCMWSGARSYVTPTSNDVAIVVWGLPLDAQRSQYPAKVHGLFQTRRDSYGCKHCRHLRRWLFGTRLLRVDL